MKRHLSKRGYRMLCLLFLLPILGGCAQNQKKDAGSETQIRTYAEAAGAAGTAEGVWQPYVEINHNLPEFSEEEKTTQVFEHYSELDRLGRCGAAYANICKELMPTAERGEIGSVRPSGWHTVKYNDLVDGNYLYNRCHLIGYQLAGENANEKNLITGTRYLNVEGMLPFEERIDDYVDATDNHVLYRVTPVFEGDNLVASGVKMEAWSVEDGGEGICFNVYAYNVQPGIVIDYATGKSRLAGEGEEAMPAVPTDAGEVTGRPTEEGAEQSADAAVETAAEQEDAEERTYILNTNTKKFHLPECSSISDMKEENKEVYKGSREALLRSGYIPCKNCDP